MPSLALSANLLAMPAVAAKTDVIVLINGDHITGEVKDLSYGQLKFKTDHMGTIYIEWDKIVSRFHRSGAAGRDRRRPPLQRPFAGAGGDDGNAPSGSDRP